jgi:hypothetical protein
LTLGLYDESGNQRWILVGWRKATYCYCSYYSSSAKSTAFGREHKCYGLTQWTGLSFSSLSIEKLSVIYRLCNKLLKKYKQKIPVEHHSLLLIAFRPYVRVISFV